MDQEPALTRVVTLDGPVDHVRTLALLRHGPHDPAHRVVEGTVWHARQTTDGPVTVAVRARDRATVEVNAWGPGAAATLDRIHLDLGAEDHPERFRPDHPVLADAVRRFPGLRMPRTAHVVEALLPAIIEQRVTGADAFSAWRRLVLRHGEPAPGPTPGPMHVPPTARQWAALASWEWHQGGVDPRRYRTAQAAVRLGPSLDRLARAGQADPVRRALRSVPGVGAWTVAEVAARALGDADAVPWGDYHLGRIIGTGLAGRIVEGDEAVARLLEPWTGHRFRVWWLLGLSPSVRIERRGPRLSRQDYRRI